MLNTNYLYGYNKQIAMPLNTPFISELQHEIATTRKFLAAYPLDNPDYKPHEKSMTIKQLTQHVAELIGWVSYTITQSELDFATHKMVTVPTDTIENLLAHYNQLASKALADLETVTDEQMREPWTLRSGENIIFTMPKIATIRAFAMNHTVHHRAQLGVYYRLLNIPVPSSFGPSADAAM